MRRTKWAGSRRPWLRLGPTHRQLFCNIVRKSPEGPPTSPSSSDLVGEARHWICEGRVGEGTERTMEEEKGPVKHMLLAKFRDELTTEKVEELIRGYANLVSLIDPMKAFNW